MNEKRSWRSQLSPEQKRFIRAVLSPFFSRNLDLLAKIQNTDKNNIHRYTPHYQKHFWKLRKKKLNILEIGVGGYDDPKRGGNSLYMWKYFFPKSQIFGLDIYEKRLPQESRVKIFRGSQVDKEFLEHLYHNELGGKLDIVIDDGSHLNEHIIETFKILFPLLGQDGIYVIEDLQTSYWKDFGGDSENLLNPKTAMNFLKGLLDCLNFEEFEKPGYQSTYFDQNIVATSFYHNMAFIFKGTNTEGSNRTQP